MRLSFSGLLVIVFVRSDIQQDLQIRCLHSKHLRSYLFKQIRHGFNNLANFRFYRLEEQEEYVDIFESEEGS